MKGSCFTADETPHSVSELLQGECDEEISEDDVEVAWVAFGHPYRNRVGLHLVFGHVGQCWSFGQRFFLLQNEMNI